MRQRKNLKNDYMLHKHIAEIYEAIRDLWKDVDVQKEATRLRLRDDVDVYYIVELLANDVAGYALSVVRGWRRGDLEQPIRTLRKLSIFQNKEFCEWYSKEGKEYPNFTYYVHTNDYLRLLTIEYLITLS